MLLILMGKTCSGKDTIAKELVKRKWDRIVTYTTRKKRRNEKDGKSYHFISEQEFIEKIETGFFAEYKSYKIADGSTVYYGSPLAEMQAADINKFIILTPQGYRDFLDRVNSDHISIYVYADDNTIRKRLKGRGDSKDEAQRRVQADREDFRGCELLANKIVYNNDGYDIKDVTNKICSFVENKGR